MVHRARQEAEEWLPLSKAAERLSVHPTTLRRWSDDGDIPVMLTPGGHRRFAISDLDAFAAERHGRRNVNEVEQLWASEALNQTRQELVVHGDQKWLEKFDDDARDRHRLLGQQLLGLTLRFLSNEEEEQQLLEQARQVGEEYALIAQGEEMCLTEALGAALFFRDTLAETALHLPENAHVQPRASRRLLHRINTLLNTVHLAIAEVYDATLNNRLSGT